MKRVVSVLIGTALATFGVSTSPAFASNFSSTTVGAIARWDDSSNTISATDTQIDSASAVAQLRRPNGNVTTYTNSNKEGSTRLWSVSVAEDANIQIRACKSDNGGAPFGCDTWRSGTS